ncbi:MAG: hypothetical protein EOO63_04145 [Hymenobacter sp.]|nr:MAG: hypothetical protein EOO63_04145 [Hymenobacter sp.]
MTFGTLPNFGRSDTVLRRRVRDLRAYYAALDKGATDTKQRMVRLSDELVQHLQAVAAPAAMQQHGQVLRQRAGLLQATNGIMFRDQAMATNLTWLLRQEPAAKVVVWAHNIHIQRDKSVPLMGDYVSKQLGPAYVAVGFATGHGTATVFNPDRSARALILAPPVSYSFEQGLDQATTPNYFLNLSQAANTDKWLTKSHKFRFIGFNEPPGGAEGQFTGFPPFTALKILLYQQKFYSFLFFTMISRLPDSFLRGPPLFC